MSHVRHSGSPEERQRNWTASELVFALRIAEGASVARTSVRIFVNELSIHAHSRARYRRGARFRNWYELGANRAGRQCLIHARTDRVLRLGGQTAVHYERVVGDESESALGSVGHGVPQVDAMSGA